MKKSILLSFFFFILLYAGSAQFKSVGLVVGAGYTVVDVEQVLESYTLEDWDNFSMLYKAFGEYQVNEKFLLGGEFGRNRLYYWEYQAPGYSYYNWRTEWTTNLVIYASYYFGENLFVQFGPGIHFFDDGTVIGFLASVGTNISVAEKLQIPLVLRIEPVLGTETPIAINFASGLKYILH